jgi:hypothetical protein
MGEERASGSTSGHDRYKKAMVRRSAALPLKQGNARRSQKPKCGLGVPIPGDFLLSICDSEVISRDEPLIQMIESHVPET